MTMAVNSRPVPFGSARTLMIDGLSDNAEAAALLL